MFENFTTQSISITPNISIHTLISPKTGPPLLLIHGFPQTHHMWHLVTPSLIEKYTLILVDLRGYGESSKPHGSSEHIEYSKSTMAADLLKVMQHLNYPTFSILAHDRGARVAHQLAINYPDAVTKMMLLDILPTLTMIETGKHSWYMKYWHWQFLAQPSPFPEQCILAQPELFGEKFLGKNGIAAGMIFEEKVKRVYLDLLRDEDTVHGMCEDYRAGVTIDLEEQRRDREAGRKISCDVMVMWGARGGVGTEFEDILGLWKEVCDGSVVGKSVDGGHYVAEQFPDEVVKMAMEFFV